MIHIEFNGLPGSGKTALYRKANDFLENKLGYKPGPEHLWTKMLREQSLKVNVHKEMSFHKAIGFRLLKLLRQSRFMPARIENWSFRIVSKEELIRAYNYESLVQFIFANREYFYRTLEAYPEHKYAEEWDKEYTFLNLEYFFILATHYQSVREYQNRSWIMYDEGFYRDSVKYVIDNAGNLDQKGIKILQCMPKVDILFHIDAEIETCIARMKTRKAGIPKPYRKYEHELYSILEKDKQREDDFCKYLESIGKRVVFIDNNGSIDESFAEIMAHLNQLYCESMQTNGR